MFDDPCRDIKYLPVGIPIAVTVLVSPFTNVPPRTTVGPLTSKFVIGVVVLIPTLLLTVSVVASRFVIVPEDEVSVVISADAMLRLLSVTLVTFRFVTVAEV